MTFDDYIDERLKKENIPGKDFWAGYEEFKVGAFLRETRKNEGLTQEQIAEKLHTTKSVISRMENHSEDIKLSTLEKFAKALGKKIEIRIVQENT